MPTSLELDAARLALLVLRASPSHRTPLVTGGIRIAPEPQILTDDAAADALAAVPKPVACTAAINDGTLEVTWSALTAGSPDFDWHAKSIALSREHGGFVGYLAKRRDASAHELTVCCIGRAETLLLSLPAAERWHEDYFIRSVQMRGDDVRNPWCVEQPQYREAKERGAVGLLIFSSPADDDTLVLWVAE